MLIRTVLLTLALLAPWSGRAAPLYTVHPLPANFHPSDINNAGQIAGALVFHENGVHTGVYAGGVVSDLGTFGASDSFATAINDAGAIAGNFGGTTGDEHAFLYQHGTLHDIGSGNAWGINARGDVVGRTSTTFGSTGFLYSQGGFTALGHLGNGNISTANAINDTGQIAGESNLAFNTNHTHPFLYDGGAMIDLGTLAGQGVSSAVAINNAGQVAGYSDAGDGRTHVFLYEHGVMTDLGGFGGLDVTIGGMNQWGQIVGTGNTADGPDTAFISRDGALVDLNTLIDPALDWTITNAIDINDGGQIVAGACRNGQCSAVRLDLASPVPEPAGVAPWLPGLLALAGLRRRQRSSTSNERA
jgi:probable HAF family extracellular repeat protein